MLWDDRLVEVWAAPGRAGAGVLVGETGVLTVRDVVEPAIADAGRVLARVVRADGVVGEWVPMEVKWHDERSGVAVLGVASSAADQWLRPSSPPVVIVAMGSGVEEGCQALGFAQSQAPHAHGEEDPSREVRQTAQAKGTVRPAEQGGPPLAAFDVFDATAGDGDGLSGMAGAGVLSADGRLLGLIKRAEDEHQSGRLHVVPLAAMIADASGFTDAVRDVTGARPVAQARNAPLWAELAEPQCLGEDGLPAPIGLLDEAAFGVAPVAAGGEPRFLEYVPRDDDGALLAGLDRAIGDGRLLLVAGDSAAGKTRSLAHAVASRLPDHRLVFPLARSLPDLASAPLGELGEAVVWLDELQRYRHESLAGALERLRQAKVPVVATMRLTELRALTRGRELRDPIGETLGDDRLVEQITWPTAWSPEERARVSDHVSSQQVLQAVGEGVPLGAYLVSGPSLLARLENARQDEDNPVRYALVRTVLDWYRTRIAQPIPVRVARRLTAERLTPAVAEDSASLDEALAWALKPEASPPFDTPVTILTAAADDRLTIAEYVLDHDQAAREIHDGVWQAALAAAGDSDRFSICMAAFEAEKPAISAAAIEPLARAGSAAAMFNLGVLLRDSDPQAARDWYEQAAGAGDTSAMFNLGVLLRDSDPQAACTWYGKAANAGHAGAMNNLGVLLERSDPRAAHDWWERAASADELRAIDNVGSAA